LHTNRASFSSISAANRRDGSSGWVRATGAVYGLSADEDQDAGRERQNAHHHNRDGDCMEEQGDANENEIDREQKHAEILRDVYHVGLSLNAMSIFHVRVGIVTTKSAPMR
jgi:hypothetical protein